MSRGRNQKPDWRERLKRWAPWLASVATLIALVPLLAPRFIAARNGAEPRADERPPAARQARDAYALPAAKERDLRVLGSPADPLPPLSDESAGLGRDAAGSTLDCIIEPFETVEIGSPVTGVIETILVERGDLVEAGQVLAALESHVERAAVEVARARARMTGELKSRQAQLVLGESKGKRAAYLFDKRAVSLDLREELETEAKLARHELERARENRELAALELEQTLAALERRTIRTPIPGVVVERLLAPGEVVDRDTIVKVAQLDPLRVEVILPSALFGSVRAGMRATVTPEQPGDEVHVAEVKIVDRVIDAASGTFGVRLELPNPDHAIPSGLHCQVRFLDE